MPGTDQPKLAEDVSDRAAKTPRCAALLYRNRAPKSEVASHYRGLLKMQNGDSYWVGLWVRRLGAERVLEIKLVPKT
jgi:hypothetical protein